MVAASLSLILAIGLQSPQPKTAQPNLARTGRLVVPLNKGWAFYRGNHDEDGLQTATPEKIVTAPWSWNGRDIQAGSHFYQGFAWFSNRIPDKRTSTKDHVYIKFGAVGQDATVYVNGQKVGEHHGAYSAFCFDITRFMGPLGKSARIDVRADNTPRPDVVPINWHLFPVFVGLDRPVQVIVTGPARIDPTYYGSPGAFIRTLALSPKFATVEASAMLKAEDAGPYRLQVDIRDQSGELVARKSRKIFTTGGVSAMQSLRLVIKEPIPWQGRQDPYLYRANFRIFKGARQVDQVVQSFGLRTYKIDPKQGFFLNGNHIALHGVDRHQDLENVGSAMTLAEERRDMQMIGDIGATCLRLSHYEQPPEIYDMTDRIGLIVWTEIPFVNAWSGKEDANALQQCAELILQNYNHPSICVWGLHNEVYCKNPTDPPALLAQKLSDLAHKLDPTRLDGAVSGSGGANEPMEYRTDVQGVNRYYGWYYGHFSDLDKWIASITKARPTTPFAITEYGAEGNIHQQSETLITKFNAGHGQFFPENYETYYHEQTYPILQSHPQIWGTFIWNMFDFTVPGWDRGGVANRNMKGLVSYDRSVKKDAFYYYKAQWSKDSVVHIVGRRVNPRKIGNMIMEVYSNKGVPSVWLNGERLAPTGHGDSSVQYLFQVQLKPGINKVVAKVAGQKDEVEWTYSP